MLSGGCGDARSKQRRDGRVRTAVRLRSMRTQQERSIVSGRGRLSCARGCGWLPFALPLLWPMALRVPRSAREAREVCRSRRPAPPGSLDVRVARLADSAAAASSWLCGRLCSVCSRMAVQATSLLLCSVPTMTLGDRRACGRNTRLNRTAADDGLHTHSRRSRSKQSRPSSSDANPADLAAAHR